MSMGEFTSSFQKIRNEKEKKKCTKLFPLFMNRVSLTYYGPKIYLLFPGKQCLMFNINVNSISVSFPMGPFKFDIQIKSVICKG